MITKTADARPPNANARGQTGRSAKLNPTPDDNIASGFAQAAAVLAELRSRGVACAIVALSFENEGAVNERGKLRAQIERLLREKALKRRRELLLMWTREARRLAGEFSRTGQWRYFRALLRHVIGRQKRLNGDLA